MGSGRDAPKCLCLRPWVMGKGRGRQPGNSGLGNSGCAPWFLWCLRAPSLWEGNPGAVLREGQGRPLSAPVSQLSRVRGQGRADEFLLPGTSRLRWSGSLQGLSSERAGQPGSCPRGKGGEDPTRPGPGAANSLSLLLGNRGLFLSASARARAEVLLRDLWGGVAQVLVNPSLAVRRTELVPYPGS